MKCVVHGLCCGYCVVVLWLWCCVEGVRVLCHVVEALCCVVVMIRCDRQIIVLQPVKKSVAANGLSVTVTETLCCDHQRVT